MAKKSKVKTPDWILEGYDSYEAYAKAKGIRTKKKKGKTFKVRKCPKCGSYKVGVVIGEIGIWECKKCSWKGKEVEEEDLTEKEFMKYLDEQEEDLV